ncbi:hypothetical protein [uncultured Mailhella sp.]|uniref:hypothetical protein n=1 Tax=uncultured Mailhella sp. TaxID=1981031 RepID=UPI00263A3537|nr:hypothetical protein [uncultured Mailhella sp.]
MKSYVATLGSGGWFLMLILSVMFSIMLGMALTWLSIDGNDTAYSIQRILRQKDAALAHIAKLEVERDSLLSPYALGKTAEEMGMSMADPGQIRRLKAAQK